jgi:hypothetical protein
LASSFFNAFMMSIRSPPRALNNRRGVIHKASEISVVVQVEIISSDSSWKENSFSSVINENKDWNDYAHSHRNSYAHSDSANHCRGMDPFPQSVQVFVMARERALDARKKGGRLICRNNYFQQPLIDSFAQTLQISSRMFRPTHFFFYF